ncbi:MAG TPA: sugar ABC transporter permease [Ktedonobacteraceae bacterium]|jgi:multiple sugar transport system permease protein|nr:sugar ABC transporter permease [Ktedonobacteraceae bacterium]
MKSPTAITPSEMQVVGKDKTMGQRRVKQKTFKTALVFWGFVGPLLLGMLIFIYIPIIWDLVLSFFNARSTITPTQFVGLQNYVSMLQDAEFTKSLLTIVIFAVFIVPLTFACSLGLALLVNSVRFARGFFRSVFFIPIACSYVAASLVWKMNIFFGQFYGLVNAARGIFHLMPIDFTSTSPYYWVVLVTVRLWLQLGLYMILFIAGLQEIPRELYEAASVDGAKKGWTTFWSITFPLLRNTSVAVLLLTIIAAFQAFDEFYNIMSGGLRTLAQPPLVYIYQVALGNSDYGRGSAGSMILVLIIVVVTLIQGRLVGFGKTNKA